MSAEFVELAWCAGFFDGEGWIGTATDKRRETPSVTLRLTVSQTISRHPLDRMQAVLGGKVQGPYMSSCTWYYQCNGIDALRAFIAMFPYLCETKREQGTVAISEWRDYLRAPKKNRHRWSIQAQALNAIVEWENSQ